MRLTEKDRDMCHMRRRIHATDGEGQRHVSYEEEDTCNRQRQTEKDRDRQRGRHGSGPPPPSFWRQTAYLPRAC